MSKMKIYTLTVDQADALFLYEGEGHNVRPSPEAVAIAAKELDVPVDTEFQWHLPDVFDIRYGSCYVGTARTGDLALRFVTDEGDWKEGDDR